MPLSSARPALLVKPGELYLKGDNRAAFIRILLDGIRDLTRDAFPDLEIDGRAGKFLLSGHGHDSGLVERVRHVFGITLVDEVFVLPSALEPIREAALEILRPFAGADGSLSEDGSRPAAGGFLRQAPSFKIDTRRTWKQFPLTSMEVNRDVGQAVVTALGLKVDLGKPEVALKIRIDADRTFLSITSHPGAGGLPVGSSGSALLLLSGGIDSPVAGYYAMRRGLRLECLHFHSPPWTGSAVTRKIDDLLGVLRRYDPRIVLHIADFAAVQAFIRDEGPEDHRVVLYRRAMLRIASSLGRARGLAAIVTGENLGQVASQTLANMACIEKAASLPVIRPLVTFDKADTIRCARSIGTFPISTRRAEDCCSLFVPEHPVTRAQAGLCADFDARLEKSGLLARCLDGIVTTSPRGAPSGAP